MKSNYSYQSHAIAFALAAILSSCGKTASNAVSPTTVNGSLSKTFAAQLVAKGFTSSQVKLLTGGSTSSVALGGFSKALVDVPISDAKATDYAAALGLVSLNAINAIEKLAPATDAERAIDAGIFSMSLGQVITKNPDL